ncbi:uncharacterized protein LOC112692961 [Sipha flava]|jgi:hypothetical protein|uniref:Uncharacterized protein LOC112692961 n=1 Tax=Sipha flava TaxID=143950 RepID=A0A8B8GKL9_9HEMI|nr:uncharacterized protein LOC112692961 [Sipha flava]
MQLLNDPIVQAYKLSLGGESSFRHVITKCQCIYSDNLPKDVHKAEKVDDLYKPLPYSKILDNIKFYVPIALTEKYYPALTMKSIIYDMLNCKNIKKVETFYCIIDLNFKQHPPCADYMKLEYRDLFLSPNDENLFDEMSLWKYLLNIFECLINGTSRYGDKDAYDLAFRRVFEFCVCVLQTDYDYSKKKGSKPLIMECLNYNPNQRTRLNEITKYLDKLFNSGYDFVMTVVKFALLVEQIRSEN